MKQFFTLIVTFAASTAAFAQQTEERVADFEFLPLATDSFINGSAGDTLISQEDFHFPILWHQDWSFWEGGWAASNQSDSTRISTDGLYQSISGSGHESDNYLIGQTGSTIHLQLDSFFLFKGLYVNNTSYAYWAMKEGDQFSKKFGGPNGTDPDYFVMQFMGFKDGGLLPSLVFFYLADFTSNNSNDDYIVSEWTWVDLSVFEEADSIMILLESTDTSEFGYNTPLFFAIDDVTKYRHTVGVNEVSKSGLSLYPNPASNALFLPQDAGAWMIFDSYGRMVLNGTEPRADLATLPVGWYVVRDEQGRTGKFLKQ